MKTFLIREVSKITGLSVHTLRYYEKLGLVRSVSRNNAGYREFQEQEILWIEFLNRLRETGMPLSRIKEFADLRYQGDSTIEARRRLLEEHQLQVRQRMSNLEKNLKALDAKIEIYRNMEEIKNGDQRKPSLSARVGKAGCD